MPSRNWSVSIARLMPWSRLRTASSEATREELVSCSGGTPKTGRSGGAPWKFSWHEFQKLYEILGVHFDQGLGESFYNHALAPLCDRLADQGLAEMSEGALCVFFRDIPALAGKPLIIRKSDGGFLYATTDLATLEYRVEKWQPSAIWVRGRRSAGVAFSTGFRCRAQYGRVHWDLQHISFGSILGEDRKIMRTRTGETIGLAELLEEAIERARPLLPKKSCA